MTNRMQKKRLQRIREWILYQLFSPLRWCFESYMRRRNWVILYCVMGNGIGDALALSTILKALNGRHGTRGIIFSMYPVLFLNNPLVVANLGYHRMKSLQRSLLKTLVRNLRGTACICFGGEVWTLGTSPFAKTTIDDQRIPGVAWIERLLPDGGVNMSLIGATPEIYFSASEEVAFKEKFKALPRPFGMVKATVGINRPESALLKDWTIEGFQYVVDQHPQLSWIQVGETGEPALSGAIDMLGKTSLREVLWLLSRSSVLLSVEGFLTHASAAFNIPTVVPFTGVHDAMGLLYPCTVPVLPEPSPVCVPCWQEVCDMPGMPCRANIPREMVKNSVTACLNKSAPFLESY